MITLLVFAQSVAYGQEQNYSINGTFENNSKQGKVYMTYKRSGRSKIDSASVVSGKFHISGQIDGVGRAYLEFVEANANNKGKKAYDIKAIYLEAANIKLNTKDSIKSASISGSKVNDDELKFNTLIAPVQTQLNQLRMKPTTPESSAQIAVLNTARTRLLKDYVQGNPNSYISLFAIRDLAGPYVDQGNVYNLFDQLSTEVKNSPDGKVLLKALMDAKRTALGKIAPDFIQPDTSGRLVKLSDFRGKYVLVDFWASWCHPCRAENPNVLKAYHKYQNYNFTVVGISIDQEKMRKNWLKAIKDDGMPWTQLIDPTNDEKGAAELYGVKAIPSNFLIDPQGKIIARNLRGAELESTLKRILLPNNL